ncbi:polysaccharide deacetylase [Bdellovibrio bacteriovorus]|uniref:Polysaccharide deacetylase n=1 Tax=Bdellovibrio bacteriovorus TaxID=959 RepID=A0A150WP84_BDEBC|nr:polysaccharide deacetylase family protein [Bdellovibrio bacteriovorus]KYG66109.1 polysaccharide deacetylase [Bdellovibrio bacteriovorus]
MKNALLKFGVSVLAASTLAACQNNFEVSQNVKQAVLDNHSATNLLEWESSPSNPEILFEKWNAAVKNGEISEQDMSAKICAGLSSLSALELTLFENEIKKSENQYLVAPCKQALQKKLDDHYVSERAGLTVNVAQKDWSAGFRFPDNIQKRDTSMGYFAWSGDVAPKEIVLTFDDGPSNEHTESILKSLKEVNAKAIFFNQGKNALVNPQIVKKIAAEGHSIGSHSMSHACLASNAICQSKNGHMLTFEEATNEIRGAHQVIHGILGWVDPFFRFPYGEASPQLKDFLKTSQVGEFAWNMDSEDWRATSNEQLLNKALSEVARAGRGIILFHDIQRRTAEIMPQFLKEVYSRGYNIVLLQPADLQSRYNSKLVRKPNQP